MSTETLALLTALATLVIAAVFVWRQWNAGTPVTLSGVEGAIRTATPEAKTLVEVATIGVQAAEQLFRSGKLPKDERLTYALNYVRKWTPFLEDVDNEDIAAAIESAVLVASFMSDQLGKRTQTLPPRVQ